MTARAFPPIPRQDFSPEESLKRASAFLKTIDDSTDVFDFRVIPKAGKATNYRGKLSKFVADFKTLNDNGAGIYVMINESDGKGCKKKNIKHVRALMIDFDDLNANNMRTILNMPLPPSVYVATSSCKYHAYWVIDNCPLERFQSIQEKLNNKFKTDPSIKDLPRVMRLPGYNHTKTDHYYPCNAFGNIGIKYSLEEFEAAFDLLAPIAPSVDSLSIVSSVSSDAEVNRKKSSDNRAEWTSNILKGVELHDSTVRLVASNISKFAMTESVAISEVKSLMMESIAPKDARFYERFNDLPRAANEWKGKQTEQLFNEFDWPDPIKIESQLKPVPPLPLDSLPQIFKSYVQDIDSRMPGSSDYSAVALFITTATVIGRKVRIQPKQKDNWEVVPNLWGAIIGRPSQMKTPTLKEATKFLNRFEIEAKEVYELKLQDFQMKSKIAEFKQKKNNALAKKCIDDSDEAAAEALLMETNDEAKCPTRKRYVVNDATVEKVGELLNENTNGLLVFRDELHGFFNSLNREANSNDRTFYIEAWNGDSNYRYDRILRGSIDIEAHTISILGGIQPSVIQPLITASINGTGGDDGLLQRFQLIVYPDPQKQFKLIDRYPNIEIKDAVYNKLLALKNWEPTNPLSNDDDNEKSYFLKFAAEAQSAFNSWFINNEQLCRADIHPALESHFTKYRSLVPSLALIIELLDCEDIYQLESVSLQSTRKAIGYVEYLRSHAERIYGLAGQADIESAKIIIAKINKLPDPFTAREVQRKGWTGLTTVENVQKALNVLEEFHYCIAQPKQNVRGGRKTVEYYKNPKIKKK